MKIVYVCDDAFWAQTLCSMASVLKHTNKNGIRLILIDQGISPEHKDYISVCMKKTGAFFSFMDALPLSERMELKYENYHVSSIFAKLIFSELFSDDTVLYMDSDTIVCNDLSSLLETDMTGYLAAGVEMPYSAQTKNKAGLSEHEPYISDGIVLLNLRLWREMNTTEQCLQYIRESGGSPFMLSEGTLNHVCRGRIRVLPLSCNVMSSVLLYRKSELEELMDIHNYYTDAEYSAARSTPHIIHFLNELYVRPWYRNSDHPYRDVYRKYLRELSLPEPSESRKLSRRTRINRFLYRCLPFSFYLKINRRARQ